MVSIVKRRYAELSGFSCVNATRSLDSFCSLDRLIALMIRSAAIRIMAVTVRTTRAMRSLSIVGVMLFEESSRTTNLLKAGMLEDVLILLCALRVYIRVCLSLYCCASSQCVETSLGVDLKSGEMSVNDSATKE